MREMAMAEAGLGGLATEIPTLTVVVKMKRIAAMSVAVAVRRLGAMSPGA